MTEFFKAELKDKFLEYALRRDDYFETQSLYDEFLRPHYDRRYVERLVEEILDYDSQLLDTISGNGVKIFMLSSTAYTQAFLEETGFKRLYIQEEEKWDSFLQHLGTRKRAKKRQPKEQTSPESGSQREKKWILGLFVLLAFSFIASLSLSIIALFAPRKLSEEAFEERMIKMEVRHQQEIESLRREIRAMPRVMPEKDSLSAVERDTDDRKK
jgi:hypothetical protein